MKKNSKELTTKELILNSAIEMVNDGGMVDFRIDDLASQLTLSPGNITYHFPRKEDLYGAMWQRFCSKIAFLDILITRIVDLKQLFLYAKALLGVVYQHRGVVMYHSGDIKLFIQDSKDIDSFANIAQQHIELITIQMVNSGIFIPFRNMDDMRKIVSIAVKQIVFWVNGEMIVNRGFDSRKVSDLVNHNALVVLFCFSKHFGDIAKVHFKELLQAVENNLIDIELLESV